MGNGGKWKAKSKRTSTKMRVKVEKKVRDHHKKLKKEMKKNPGKFKKSKKDPGVPGNCPFKDKVLEEAKAMVQKRAEEKEKRRIELKEIRKASKQNKVSKGLTLESMVAGAEMKNALFEKGKGVQKAASDLGLSDRSAKAYYKEFRKVVEAADVVLQILDARDPLGSRCLEVEEAVVAGGKSGKRLVLVLNKADLVPRDNLNHWVKYLRNEYPTIAFKASTQLATKLGHAKIDMKQADVSLNTSKCVGADTLMALLGNYCRNRDIKTSIRVGVVGMPNVGKSSLINSLKRSRACNVGATPGVTKAMQEVQLDKKVKLLDSPGLVMAGGNRNDAGVALRNAVKTESIEDPVTPVIAILARVPKKHLMLQYGIGEYRDCSEFLALVAARMGKLKRGGIPDREKAARILLGDWNSGKIKYFTHPPEQERPTESNLGAEIVSQFAQEFSLDKLDQTEEMDTLPAIRPSDIVQVESGSVVRKAAEEDEAEMEDDEEDDDEEDVDKAVENAENILPQRIEVLAKKTKKEKKGGEDYDPKEDPLFKIEGNMRMKKAMKLEQKKIKKNRKRADKLAAGLSEQMESAFSSLVEEDYNVDKDFVL